MQSHYYYCPIPIPFPFPFPNPTIRVSLDEYISRYTRHCLSSPKPSRHVSPILFQIPARPSDAYRQELNIIAFFLAFGDLLGSI